MAERNQPRQQSDRSDRAEAAQAADAARATEAARHAPPVERAEPEPQTKKEARVVDAEAADAMLSAKEQEKVETGQGRTLDEPAQQHASSVDPNRALDLPPHMVTGDMKKDALRAYSGEEAVVRDNDPGTRQGGGPADEQPKGEQNPK